MSFRGLDVLVVTLVLVTLTFQTKQVLASCKFVQRLHLVHIHGWKRNESRIHWKSLKTATWWFYCALVPARGRHNGSG